MAFRWQRLDFWRVLSGMLGLVLLAATALKGQEIATEELLEDSLLSSRWFLMIVVEWEIFFALWFLGGFYRLYPRLTCWVALLYFFALFVVAMDSVLKGRPTCPCFGKSLFPPWIAATFDVTALLLLAVAPLPQAVREPRHRSRWLALSVVFSAFGLLTLITMRDYSTEGVIPSIRRDGRLFAGTVTIQRVRPTTEDLLALLKNTIDLKTADLNLTVDVRLQNRQPDYGLWDVKAIQPWTMMELLAHRQMVPARWQKVEEGYELVAAASFGKNLHFWLGGATLLALSMLGLRWRDVVEERKKALSGDTATPMRLVAGLHTARYR